MKVIDCFPFFDEFLILDIRFRELYDVVDKFFIVESRETFTGKEKPLYLSECYKERYPQYADKIEIIVPEKFETADTWAREFFQKNHICKENLKYLNLDDQDLILFADADEIPKRAIIENMRKYGFDMSGGGFGGKCFYYKLNILTTEWSHRPRWISYQHFDKFMTQRLDDSFNIITGSGWHFTYLKTVDKIKEKIEAFSHQEFNTNSLNTLENIEYSVNNIKDIFHREGIILSVVDVDDSYPEYVKENKDKLKGWIA